MAGNKGKATQIPGEEQPAWLLEKPVLVFKSLAYRRAIQILVRFN